MLIFSTALVSSHLTSISQSEWPDKTILKLFEIIKMFYKYLPMLQTMASLRILRKCSGRMIPLQPVAYKRKNI